MEVTRTHDGARAQWTAPLLPEMEIIQPARVNLMPIVNPIDGRPEKVETHSDRSKPAVSVLCTTAKGRIYVWRRSRAACRVH